MIRGEQDLPGTEGGQGGKGWRGSRVEKWPKQCMHMWINEQKINKWKIKLKKKVKNSKAKSNEIIQTLLWINSGLQIKNK
jgi:hypothetical protein